MRRRARKIPRRAYTDPKLEPAIVTIGPAASYDGVARRRTAAFLLDMVILLAIVSVLWLLNFLNLFVLSALLGLLGPVINFLAYRSAAAVPPSSECF